MRRNTAPCIAYANYKIQLEDPNAIILVAPSDHIILKESDFLDVVKKGLEFVAATTVCLPWVFSPTGLKPDTDIFR